MKEKPNILVLLTDQQNSAMMSCAGNAYLNTPAMDNLAAEGVRFTKAYCTNPVCVPARFSLMTGLMPHTIGMISNAVNHIEAIPDSIKKRGLGYLMREAGYDAAYAGKVHLPKMSAEDVGFEYISGDERALLAENCIEFMQRKRNRPFFLFASFINPHDICYMALQDFAKTNAEHRTLKNGAEACATLDKALSRPEGVDDETFFSKFCPPLPDNFEPQISEPEAIKIMLEHRSFRKNAREKWSDERWREHRWAYARLTEFVDRQIAQVINAVTRSNLSDSTAIVFTSDHGDMDAAHRLEHKSTLYDEACHIPLIIRPPGGTSARVDNTHLVSNGLDLVPTCCDMAGINPPEKLPGKSVRPLLDNENPTHWRSSVPVECAIGRAVITERFKYCLYDIGKNREQLIDLENDPGEQQNELDNPSFSEEIESLRNKFNKTFKNTQRNSDEIIKSLPYA